jgi:hypothetical protein
LHFTKLKQKCYYYHYFIRRLSSLKRCVRRSQAKLLGLGLQRGLTRRCAFAPKGISPPLLYTDTYQDKQCSYKQNIKARSRNHCCSGKAVSITYSEIVCLALFFQHAKRMRHFILSSEACLSVLYISILSQKQCEFRGKFIEHKMCVFILSATLFEIFLILRRVQRDIIINVHRSSCKVQVNLLRY